MGHSAILVGLYGVRREWGSACLPVTQEDVQSGHELLKEGCVGKPVRAPLKGVRHRMSIPSPPFPGRSEPQCAAGRGGSVTPLPLPRAKLAVARGLAGAVRGPGGSWCGWIAPVWSPFLWTMSSRDRLEASVESTVVSVKVSGVQWWWWCRREGETETSDTASPPPPPPDDFLEPGGGLAALAATFGNSWRLPDSEVRCSPQCLGLLAHRLHSQHLASLTPSSLFRLLQVTGAVPLPDPQRRKGKRRVPQELT